MYLMRFSYDLLPANREKAVALIRREVEAAKARGLRARLLIPLTRGRGEAALQYEVELPSLNMWWMNTAPQPSDPPRRLNVGCESSVSC